MINYISPLKNKKLLSEANEKNLKKLLDINEANMIYYKGRC